ncbi:hypothetical protein [Pelomonas sp. KK5]|uniref:hypothetical protein n=1 Tax=Pelomonas sp. KK5 TaxID=1855730 RepID=UPI001180255A|nr:hypothetical protein [Pelomonas sp. KK5]
MLTALAWQRRDTARRRRQIDPAAMRVHLALQRYRRNIRPGRDGLHRRDLRLMRERLSPAERQAWDEALQAYEEARSGAAQTRLDGEPCYRDTSEIATGLDRLLALGTRRS